MNKYEKVGKGKNMLEKIGKGRKRCENSCGAVSFALKAAVTSIPIDV